MSDKTSDKLLPCPFCGGEVGIFETHDHRFEIWHGEEDSDMNCPLGATECVGGWIYDTKEHAITAWNTRKPMERIVERLEEESKFWQRMKQEELSTTKDIELINRYDAFEIAINNAIEIVKDET